MIPFAKAQHHIRRFVASVIDCSFSERAKGFRSYEAGDFLIATERARQVLVEREEREEVAEPKSLPCPYHGEWCAGDQWCWWIKSQDSAHAGADPTSVAPAAEVEGPAGVSDIPPSPPVGLPTSDLMAELADAVGDHYDNGKAVDPGILWHESGVGEAIDWRGVARTLLIYFDIQRRPLSTEARAANARIAKQIHDTGIESSLDMGARMASEFFPQSTKHQK